MAVISMFYGIIVSLYYLDTKHHHCPHLHVRHQVQEAVLSIPECNVLAGSIPPAKMRLVLAWVEIHRDDLLADWELAVSGQPVFRVEPLR